jgi:hypothetical protein
MYASLSMVHTGTPFPCTVVPCVGNLSPAKGARNQVGIGLSYWPASLCCLATQFQTRFQESGLVFDSVHVRNASTVRLSLVRLSPAHKARIFKLLRSPGIDFKEFIPPAYVAWRVDTITLFLLGS